MFDSATLGRVEVAEEVSGLSHGDARRQVLVLARESILVKGIVSLRQTVGVKCDRDPQKVQSPPGRCWFLEWIIAMKNASV
jgi:hypothetical protein